ncbi:hypothetical protein B0A48_05502 [Cryoendolithus antarcticus]|uniref:F-box domain-containing protein n=1 Tax=Cryoendolithus antarcticus TaxID=1507870 RepID=A0A1V8TIQ9_9PEZI|nr:hypothetical protein B0A48_05502 [Cryoendolithus antarcticus]
MEQPRTFGLGLRKHSPAPFDPEAILSTAPASPTEEMPPTRYPHSHADEAVTTMTSRAMPPPNSTIASLAFGPATQQTVVTTTTTTTVSLPPLIMNPPKDLFERDPKQYPLAFTPTPRNVKRFCFEVNGRPTMFHESEDAEETMRKHRELQAKMQRHEGVIRQELSQAPQYRTPGRSFEEARTYKSLNSLRPMGNVKQVDTPPSLAEAAELASLQRKAKKPRSSLQRSWSEAQEVLSLNQRVASGGIPLPAEQPPVTPDTDVGALEMAPPKAASSRGSGKRRKGIPQSKLREVRGEDDEDEEDEIGMEEEQDDAKLGASLYGRKSKGKRTFSESTLAGAVATPPIGDADMEDEIAAQQDAVFRRPNLPAILTSSQLDASLPSPSLSPITAAANAASRQNAFENSFARHIEAGASAATAMDIDDGSKTSNASSFGTLPTSLTSQPRSASPAPLTVMNIPTMVDAFDSMPEALQTYVMYQLLRRSTKPTLQMIASVVNPALKCDPFNVLPAELGLNIARYLDAKSMCRAAQVSKRWRRLINTDERAWKNLLERDEYDLPEGELEQAVRQGWGWQQPGEDGYEQDLSPVHESYNWSDEEEASASNLMRAAKRKSLSKFSGSKKSRPRVSKIAKLVKEVPLWKKIMSGAKGPTGHANAAIHAVPDAQVGLDSLRGMHLYKSLYQRHHFIRKAWMSEESKPQHLAFRAHHRHVVTCLLFDSDKILTGSDDTKINVYDTKTGALRTRLEGHEGGVWALQYDGDTLVSGSTDRSVRVWDIKSGKLLQVFQGHTSTVRCLVILKPVQIGTEDDDTPIMMPKEPLIITGSRDSTLRVWKLPLPSDRGIFQAGPPVDDTDNPYFLRTLSGHHSSVRAIAAHGDTLVSGSYDCTVRVWKISTGDLLHRLQGHTQKVYSVVLDHDRNRCISGSMDNLVKVWDLGTGSCLFNLEGHTSLVGLLDLSHDRLVSAAADSTLRIWDPENGNCKATLSAHTGAITCFQHDGVKVISGSDRTLKMWNVKTGECVRDLLTELSGVWQVRFDERRCVAAVQRNNLTYIEVLDFGASRDGVPAHQCGRRMVVNGYGKEIEDPDAVPGVAPGEAETEAA